MQPFRFRTAAQAMLDATTADEALAYALNDVHDHETRLRMLLGVAERPDITRAHVKTILEQCQTRAGKVLATLWSNPTVAHHPDLRNKVISRISRDDIFSFLLLPNNEDVLPHLIARCANVHFPDHAVYIDALKNTFTPEQMNAALNVLVDGFADTLDSPTGRQHPLTDLLHSTLLAPDHLDRLISMVEHAVSDAATPLPSGRSRRRNAEFEARLNRMSTAQDIIATLLARKDLTESQCLSLVESGAKVLADAVAFTAPTQRKWIRASTTDRLFRNASLTPQAVAFVFNADIFRVSLKSVSFNGAGAEAAILATATNPNPVLVQRVLNAHFSLSEHTTQVLLDQVRFLERQFALNTAAPDGLDEDDFEVWGRDDNAWWGTSGERSDRDEQDVLRGLLRNAKRHIGKPVWDEVYAFVLAHPHYSQVSHAQAVDAAVAVLTSDSTRWADDSMTPTLHEFAAWASASDDEHLRRHAVAQCWDAAQLGEAAQDPSPLVRIEALRHDLATPDVVLITATDTDADIRLAAAAHPMLDQRAINILADDPDERVRNEVAHRVLEALRNGA